ncbi:MAG TPA: zinc-binding dehydrogenase, partial [Pyrinomonadaceae bacterium]|nr:zinc-binding dehydrogenase [Pyrinomonadaceae bacterium]
CLATGGTMIVYGAASGADFQVSALSLLFKMQTVKGYNLNYETRENIAAFTVELMKHFAENRLQVMVSEFPLEQAREAHNALEGRKTMGKIVLTV